MRASLPQAAGPKFKEELDTGIIRHNTAGPAQGMKLISLDIHFDQVHAMAGLEVVIQRYHLNRHGATCVSVSSISAMINVEGIRKIELGVATALSNRGLQGVDVGQRTGSGAQPLEIIWRRFKRVDAAGRANTAGEKLRVNPDICPGIHHNCAGKEHFSQ